MSECVGGSAHRPWAGRRALGLRSTRRALPCRPAAIVAQELCINDCGADVSWSAQSAHKKMTYPELRRAAFTAFPSRSVRCAPFSSDHVLIRSVRSMSLDAESFNHERDDLERSDTRTTGTPGGSKPAVSAVGNERKRLYEQDLNPGDFKKVRAKSRCDHGDARTAAGPPSASKAAEKTNQCKERDGFAVCQHSRIKNRCKDCGGSPKRKDRS